MKVNDKKKILAILLAVLMAVASTSAIALAGEEYAEEELGIRKKSLYSEEEVSPGASKRFRRAFENSPPLIPHDLTGMLPVSETNNMCLNCHMPKLARMTGAVSIPKTHLMDMDTGEDLGGELDGARFNCMQCHVPQVNVPPVVENMFKEEFRDRKSEYNSNLAETLNEGVEAE